MEMNSNAINPKHIKVKSIDCEYAGKTFRIHPEKKSLYGFVDWFGIEILDAMCGKKKK